MMDALQAQTLAQKLWQQIERRRYSSGTSSKPGQTSGVRGMLDYYRGEHNLRFASAQFRDHFQQQFAGFSDNWCATVIDATAERLNWNGIRIGDGTQAADTDFQRIFDANDGARGTSECFTVAMAASRSFAMVWGNKSDPDTPLITWEHPEYCAIAVDPETRQTTAAAKGWYEDDNNGALTLYTADQIFKWNWQVVNDRDARREVSWKPTPDNMQWSAREIGGETWPMPNPLGRVPMVEFRNQTLLDDKPLSDLEGVAAMQDAINLVWAYLFNGLDFATLPQRVVMGAEVPSVPILDSDGHIIGDRVLTMEDLKTRRFLWLPTEGASIGEWSPSNLDVFQAVIEMAVDHVSSQSRTPPHYLMGKMSNVAAESLSVAETGLVAKAGQRSQYFTAPLRELHQLAALAIGDKAKAKAASTGKIVWQDPQYRSLAQKIDAATKLRSIGLPVEWIVEWIGQEPSEVARIMAMIDTEYQQSLVKMQAQAAAQQPSGATPTDGADPASATAPPSQGLIGPTANYIDPLLP